LRKVCAWEMVFAGSPCAGPMTTGVHHESRTGRGVCHTVWPVAIGGWVISAVFGTHCSNDHFACVAKCESQHDNSLVVEGKGHAGTAAAQEPTEKQRRAHQSLQNGR